MWIVVQHQYGCSPAVVAMFNRCCQAMSRAAELSKEFPADRFYPRLEGNFVRRSIDDIPTSPGTKEKSKKTKTVVTKEVVSGY